MRYPIERSTLKKRSVEPSGRRNEGDETADCELAFIGKTYLQDILELQEIVSRSLPDKDLFRISSEYALSDLFITERSFIGVFVKDRVSGESRLIAYSIIRLPGKSSENLGEDIGLSAEDLKRTAHLKALAVHPEFRGCSLQRKMMELHLGVLKEMGYRHVCSTVSPKNYFSLKNFFSKGFVIRGLKIKYGSMLRYIMHRDLTAPAGHCLKFSGTGLDRSGTGKTSEMHLRKATGELRINSLDTKRQLELLGCGFVGFKVEGSAEAFEVAYALEKTI